MSCGCGGGCGGGCGAPPPGPFTFAAPQPPAGCGDDLFGQMQSTVDQMRQMYTDFGLRVYQVFLVWTRWTGEERGEGQEREIARVQILPNPKVDDMTKIALTAAAAGILPVGSLQISEITANLTADNLRGLTIPGQQYFDGCGFLMQGIQTPVGTAGLSAFQKALGEYSHDKNRIPQPYEFFYEVVENRAGSRRLKFRLFAEPFRDPENFQWKMILERISEDRTRAAQSRYGPDPDE